MDTQPTVFIVDPDGPTRDAVRNVASSMDLRCEAYSSGQEFLEVFDPSRPGCVILEIRVPGINGLQIQETLAEQKSALPIVFLSAQPSVSIAVYAMRAGALHFLEKPFREHDLWNAIQEAIEVDQRRRSAILGVQEMEKRMATLTAKEQQVFEMLAEGKTKTVMAREMDVSTRTIEHHRTQLMRKLGANSLAGLLHFALCRTKEKGNGHLLRDRSLMHR